MACLSDVGPRKVLDLHEHLNYWSIKHVSSQEFQDIRIASFFTIKGLFAKSLWTVFCLWCMCVCLFQVFLSFWMCKWMLLCSVHGSVMICLPLLVPGVQALGYLCTWCWLSDGGTRTAPELIEVALSGHFEGMVQAMLAVSSRIAFLWSKMYLLNVFL